MTVWRISNHATLDGRGGLRASSRWHTRGRRIVFCAPNPATALLEVLVHAEVDVEDIPVTYRYLEIEVPDSLNRETTSIDDLAQNWRTDSQTSRHAGDEWLQSGRTVLLLAPCAIVPATWNVLINPQHRDASRIKIARTHEQPMDRRLLNVRE